MPTPSHLKSIDDLTTSAESTRAGFLSLAIERNRLATPLVGQGRALRTEIESIGSVASLVTNTNLAAALLAAAGVSDKAAKHLGSKEKAAAIKDLVDTYMAPAGTKFADEMVYRYLLTRGDALGGKMRNVGGTLAQRKLIRALASSLDIVKSSFRWLDEKKHWRAAKPGAPDFEIEAKGLQWKSGPNNRILLFNRKIPAVGTNVDLCLLSCAPDQIESAIKSPGAFVALGELKGGIDPAGADEHWKTARSALARIGSEFAKSQAYPQLFFIGAAIVKHMASEIWDSLKANTLANAANLTDDNQLSSIARWIRQL